MVVFELCYFWQHYMQYIKNLVAMSIAVLDETWQTIIRLNRCFQLV